MRFHLCATLSALMLLAPLAPAEASHIIEVNKPKPKPRPKPKKEESKKEEAAQPKAKSFEMRLQMSDNQVSRDLSAAIFKRFEDYGYQMAPEIAFGQIPKEDKEAPVYQNTFFFEVVQSDDACFIVSKVMDSELRSALWRWETEDDGKLPCEVQMKIAIKDYAWKNPPIKQADDFVAIEADIEAAAKKLEVDKKNREAARKAAEAAEAEAEARRASLEAERRKQAASAPAAPVALADYGQQDKGLGCSAAAASMPFFPAALALALGAFRRRTP